MSKTKDLSEFSETELIEELARRKAVELPEKFTMSHVERAVDEMFGSKGPPAVAAMLSRMKPEKPTPKTCPRCGKRTPVKARDRERTVRSLAGLVTFKRNYHYCKDCKYGFHPVDQFLDLPEEGELTPDLEARIIDFAVNTPFEQVAARWSVHYRQHPISSNLVRRVTDRVGRQCAESDGAVLQRELAPPPRRAAKLLVIQTDGSHLPMRGPEPWKEAKLGVIVRGEHYVSHREAKRGSISQARYVAVVGGQEEFAHELRQALHVERAQRAERIVWVGDGAPSNWTMAALLAGTCTQILDWHHAVEHGMGFGRALLGDDSPYLSLWKERLETLLAQGDVDALISELLACGQDAASAALTTLDALVGYYRSNAKRMQYAEYLRDRLPIGSGIVESAHRHVLQTRMKQAGQHWSIERARRMARLRAAYRTSGPQRFHEAIRTAHSKRLPTLSNPPTPRVRQVGERSGTFVRRRASNR